MKKSNYSSAIIVSEIKQNLKTSSEFYSRFIESNTLFSLDTVRNAEFLKKGWSENVIHKDVVAKEPEENFTFVMNFKNAELLIIEAALSGEDVYLRPVTLTFSSTSKRIGEFEVRYGRFSQHIIKVPKEFRKPGIVIVGKVKKTDKDTKVFIKSFTATTSEIVTDSFQESIFELERMKRDSNQILQFLDMHKNPEHLLPAGSQSNIIKKIGKKVVKVLVKIPPVKKVTNSLVLKRLVLKLIRPFTTPQIQFNQYMLELITLQSKRFDKLEEMLLSSLKVKNKKNEKKDSSVR